MYNSKNIAEKKAALDLAVAKHIAKQALVKLQAEGVIQNHSMGTFPSGSFTGFANLVDDNSYTPTPPSTRYTIRKGNKFSEMFESVFNRTIGLRDDYANQMMAIMRQQQASQYNGQTFYSTGSINAQGIPPNAVPAYGGMLAVHPNPQAQANTTQGFSPSQISQAWNGQTNSTSKSPAVNTQPDSVINRAMLNVYRSLGGK